MTHSATIIGVVRKNNVVRIATLRHLPRHGRLREPGRSHPQLASPQSHRRPPLPSRTTSPSPFSPRRPPASAVGRNGMRRRRIGRDKRRTRGTIKTAPHDRHETSHAAWTRFWRVRQRRRVMPLWRMARGSAGRSCGHGGYMVSILSSGAVSFVSREYPRWSCGPEVRACVVQTNPRAGLRQVPGCSRGVHDSGNHHRWQRAAGDHQGRQPTSASGEGEHDGRCGRRDGSHGLIKRHMHLIHDDSVQLGYSFQVIDGTSDLLYAISQGGRASGARRGHRG